MPRQALATRPFFKSTLTAIADFGTSPFRLEGDDLRWVLPTAMLTVTMLQFDIPLHNALANGPARQDFLNHAMPIVSELGEGWVELSAVAAASVFGNERMARTSQTAMQGLAVSAFYSSMLKAAAWSNRPSQNELAHRFWAWDQASTGLPSGHSFTAFCLAEVYGIEYGRWRTYPFAALVGYSRIYNHAHWPSDVLAGAVLGIAAGWQASQATAKDGPPVIKFGMQSTEHTSILVAQMEY